jgi:N-methylhydantoinase B
VLIPPAPGHFSAIAMLQANLRFDRRTVFNVKLEHLDTAALTDKLSGIKEELTQIIGRQGEIKGEQLKFSYGLKLRYQGQEHTLMIQAPFSGIEIPPDAAETFRTLFEEEYLIRFGHQHKTAGVEVVEVEGVVELELPSTPIHRRVKRGMEHVGTIEGNFGRGNDPTRVSVVPRTALREGEVFAGPMIVYEEGSNVVVSPGVKGRVIEGGYLLLDVSGIGAGDRPAEKVKRIDVVDVEVFRHAITGLLDELEVNLTRTAYSPLIYEYKDYTVGILSAQFELMNQSRMSLPAFLADLGQPVRDAVEIIGAENLRSGDILITNYAAAQGQHINNVIAAMPVFGEGRVIAYLVFRSHWADVGGYEPGSVSWNTTDVFQEGTQYRGIRVMQAGRVVPEVLETILANTRMEEWVRGDLMAQLGGCTLGARRWEERIASKWDANALSELWRIQREQSAEFARRRIRELPDGSYEATCRLDDAGQPGSAPLVLKVKVLIDDDRMVIDFTGMPPQVSAPINIGASGGAISLARVGYKSLIAPDQPADQGLFDPLEVRLVEGTLITARKGAALSMWNCSMPTVVDLVLRAIGESSPELVPAGHHGTMGIFMFSGQDKGGKFWQNIDTALGGWGASAHADGFSPLKTLTHGDNRDIPVEIAEARFPLKVLQYSFVPDSGGRGRYRGGLGVEKIIEATGDIFFMAGIDRTLDPAWGLAGGESGRPGRIDVKRPGDEAWLEFRKVSRLSLPKGSVVRVRSAGGGGWGRPEERSEAAKARDRLEGFVTE